MTSLFSRLFGGERKSARDGAMVARLSYGLPSYNARDDLSLTRRAYGSNPIAYRAVRMVAEAVASVPWSIYRGRTELPDHPLKALIAQPCATDPGASLLEALVSNLLLFGNAYAEAVLVDGEPRELHALRPDRMCLEIGMDGWPQAYLYSVNGDTVTYRIPADGISPILHLKIFHPLDDHYGYAPLRAAQGAVEIHNAATGWNRALLDNAARPSGALVYAGPEGSSLTDEQFDRLRRELDDSFAGMANAGRPLLLEGGLDWKSFSMSPRDMDNSETRAAAARDIALAFGVPPMVLGLPGDNTYSNYQEANRVFWRQTVIPLIARLQRSVGVWLAPAFGDIRIDSDLDRIDALSAERESEWKRIDSASFLTQDEKREAVGYGPLR